MRNTISSISVSKPRSSLLSAMLYGSATKTSRFPNRPMRIFRSLLPEGMGINRSIGTGSTGIFNSLATWIMVLANSLGETSSPRKSMSIVRRGLPSNTNALPPVRSRREAGGTRSPKACNMDWICGSSMASESLDFQPFEPNLYSVLVCTQPVHLCAAQFLMAFCQRLQISFRIVRQSDSQHARKQVGKKRSPADENIQVSAVFSLHANRRTVIALQGKARSPAQFLRSLLNMPCELGVFKKERNERQTQTRFVAFRQRSDKQGRLLMKGFFRIRSTHEEMHTENMQGACQLIARSHGDAAHKIIISYPSHSNKYFCISSTACNNSSALPPSRPSPKMGEGVPLSGTGEAGWGKRQALRPAPTQPPPNTP